MLKLHTENYGGNLHETATWVNKAGLAEYVLVMSSSGYSTQVVFRMPAELVYKLREERPSYVGGPHHDDPPEREHFFACGKRIPLGEGNTNANTACGAFNCGPCNEFIHSP